MYGEETLAQVATQAQEVAHRLDAASDIPLRIVFRPVLTEPDAIRRACLDARHADRCAGVIAWMHTFSPAKMWIGGLQELGKPLLHLHTQANESLPWSTIDMDFMNLNQAAHGDREFASIQTRMGLERKTVFGHVSDPEVQASVGRWARAAAGHHTLRHLALARFGDNMRQVAVTEGDKVEAQIRFGVVGQHVGRQRPRRGGRPSGRSRGRCSGRRVLRPLPGRVRAGSRRRAARIPPRRRRHRGRAAPVPPRRGLRRLHDELRRSRWTASAPRPGGAAAHGGRIRLRRGGRLEDRGPAACHQGHG